MPMKTLNVKIPEEEYEKIEEIVKDRHYTSKAEFIRDLLRQVFDEYIRYLHKKAREGEFVPLRKFGKEERGEGRWN